MKVTYLLAGSGVGFLKSAYSNCQDSRSPDESSAPLPLHDPQWRGLLEKTLSKRPLGRTLVALDPQRSADIIHDLRKQLDAQEFDFNLSFVILPSGPGRTWMLPDPDASGKIRFQKTILPIAEKDLTSLDSLRFLAESELRKKPQADQKSGWLVVIMSYHGAADRVGFSLGISEELAARMGLGTCEQIAAFLKDFPRDVAGGQMPEAVAKTLAKCREALCVAVPIQKDLLRTEIDDRLRAIEIGKDRLHKDLGAEPLLQPLSQSTPVVRLKQSLAEARRWVEQEATVCAAQTVVHCEAGLRELFEFKESREQEMLDLVRLEETLQARSTESPSSISKDKLDKARDYLSQARKKLETQNSNDNIHALIYRAGFYLK